MRKFYTNLRVTTRSPVTTVTTSIKNKKTPPI